MNQKGILRVISRLVGRLQRTQNATTGIAGTLGDSVFCYSCLNELQGCFEDEKNKFNKDKCKKVLSEIRCMYPKMSSNKLSAERDLGAAVNHKLVVNQQWDAVTRKAKFE